MKIGTYYNGMYTAAQVRAILSSMGIEIETLPRKGEEIQAFKVPHRMGHQVHLAWDRMTSNSGERLYRLGHSHPEKPGIPFAWGGPFEDGAGEIWLVDRPDLTEYDANAHRTELTPQLVDFVWDCITDLKHEREHWANSDEEEEEERRARIAWWADFQDGIEKFRGAIAGEEWRKVSWKIGGASTEKHLDLNGIPERVALVLQDDGAMEIRDLREDRLGWVSAYLRHTVVSPLTPHLLGYYKGFIASEIYRLNPHIEWIS